MKFCPDCNNLLMSKNKKVFCKTCGKSFEVKPDEKTDYMLKKKIPREDLEFKPYVLKNDSRKRNGVMEYRKAYEDYFSSSE